MADSDTGDTGCLLIVLAVSLLGSVVAICLFGSGIDVRVRQKTRSINRLPVIRPAENDAIDSDGNDQEKRRRIIPRVLRDETTETTELSVECDG